MTERLMFDPKTGLSIELQHKSDTDQGDREMNAPRTVRPTDVIRGLIQFVASLDDQRTDDLNAHGNSNVDADYILDEIAKELDRLNNLHH